MAWNAPTFDITGKSYTVDPRPVQEVIQQGANIQKDALKNLAGVVQSGIDVAQGMMARRQLSELKVKLANLDPTGPDYAQARANLLADNMTAFTDPRTKGVASEILSGFDKVRDNEVAKQKAAISASAIMDRAAFSNANQAQRQEAGFDNQRAMMLERERLRNTRTNAESPLDQWLRNRNGTPPPAAAPAAAGGMPAGAFLDETGERVGSVEGSDVSGMGGEVPVRPALPDGGAPGGPDPSLLQPGDDFPPTPAAPAAPAAPAQPVGPSGVQGPPAMVPQVQLTEEQVNTGVGAPPVGGGGIPGDYGMEETVWTLPEADPRRVRDKVGLEAHMGRRKADELAALRILARNPQKGTSAAAITAVQEEIGALERDSEVRDYMAQKNAGAKIAERALIKAAEGPKDPAVTAAATKNEVENAVDFELADEQAGLKAAQDKAADLRKQAGLSGADHAVLDPKLAEADALASKMLTDFTRKKAESSARWTGRIHNDPDAFRRVLAARDAEAARMNYLETEFADVTGTGPAKDDARFAADPAYRADVLARPRGVPNARTSFTGPDVVPPVVALPKEAAAEEEVPSTQSPEEAAWGSMQRAFDKKVGADALHNAVTSAIRPDGTISQALVEAFLADALKDTGKGSGMFETAGEAPRPFYQSNTITNEELIRERAKDLIKKYQADSSAPTAAASKVKGYTFKTRNVP